MGWWSSHNGGGPHGGPDIMVRLLVSLSRGWEERDMSVLSKKLCCIRIQGWRVLVSFVQIISRRKTGLTWHVEHLINV